MYVLRALLLYFIHLSVICIKSFGYSFSYCSDSMTMAEAPPPPLQIPAQPTLPFFSLSTLSRVVVILAPEAPRA